MSVKIQPQQNVLPETGPKETVPLSERVLARQPPPQPPEQEENPTALLPEATQPDEYMLTDGLSQTPLLVALPTGQKRSGEMPSGNIMNLAVLRRAAADPARAAAAAEARKGLAHGAAAGHGANSSSNTVVTPPLISAVAAETPTGTAAEVAAITVAKSASAEGASPVAKVASTRGNADSLPGTLPTGAGSVAGMSSRPAPTSLSREQAQVGAPASGLLPIDDGALSSSVPQIKAAETGGVADIPASFTAFTQNTAPPPGGDGSREGQSLADADRAAANLETQRQVRVARQASALQTAMETRASASHVQVGFNSWGVNHSVNVYMHGTQLRMQPSSEQVGKALSSAEAPTGADLHIDPVDSSDSATSERRGRRNGQNHA